VDISRILNSRIELTEDAENRRHGDHAEVVGLGADPKIRASVVAARVGGIDPDLAARPPAAICVLCAVA
jgi:hypothetical protein